MNVFALASTQIHKKEEETKSIMAAKYGPLILAVTPPLGGALFIGIKQALLASQTPQRRKATAEGIQFVSIVVATSFMLLAGLGLIEEVLRDTLERSDGAPLPDMENQAPSSLLMTQLQSFYDSLFFHGDALTYGTVFGFVAGCLAVLASTRLTEDKGIIMMLAMAFHTACEGAAVGIAGTKQEATLRSIGLHNIFEGAVVSAAQFIGDDETTDEDPLGHGGGKKHKKEKREDTLWALCSPMISHCPQWATLLLIQHQEYLHSVLAFFFLSDSSSNHKVDNAATSSSLSLLLVGQGFSAGSILAMCVIELVPEAAELRGGSLLQAVLSIGAVAAVLWACEI